MKNNFSELDFIKVAATSPIVSIGNPIENAEQIAELTSGQAKEGISISVFPELSLSGYSAEDLFFSEQLIKETVTALSFLAHESQLPCLVVGTPWRMRDGRLLNCAAIIAHHQIIGMVPKSAHPNHGEFYDLRWFSDGAQVNESIIDKTLGNFQIRIDQLFEVGPALIGIEICEDLWSPINPGTAACLAGANLLVNPSASNELIAKADYRKNLVQLASAKNLCGYVYAGAGPTESTKDIVYGGHCLICETGYLLQESPRFNLSGSTTVSEIDIGKIRHDRAQNKTFSNAQRSASFRISTISDQTAPINNLTREISRHPFIPASKAEFDSRALEILKIQSTGLARRMMSANTERLVIGLSGGLDSTLAFLVCLETLKVLDLAPTNLHALTMPGPGTTDQTKNNAHELASSAGIELKEIDINKAVDQHLTDLEHEGEHDVVYENSQARERTQILFDYANKIAAIVVGTGDLSELALGWCTFNADQMSNYNVNVSIPKTMIAYLVDWYALNHAKPRLANILKKVIATPISPELVPPTNGKISQKTEEIIGPYELHDFFLFHFLRHGATPSKIFKLAIIAFSAKYSENDIQGWLKIFFTRFFNQQFKRTTLPPGPKVGSVSLSPRGDWRMPDEASAKIYLDEIEHLI